MSRWITAAAYSKRPLQLQRKNTHARSHIQSFFFPPVCLSSVLYTFSSAAFSSPPNFGPCTLQWRASITRYNCLMWFSSLCVYLHLFCIRFRLSSKECACFVDFFLRFVCVRWNRLLSHSEVWWRKSSCIWCRQREERVGQRLISSGGPEEEEEEEVKELLFFSPPPFFCVCGCFCLWIRFLVAPFSEKRTTEQNRRWKKWRIPEDESVQEKTWCQR